MCLFTGKLLLEYHLQCLSVLREAKDLAGISGLAASACCRWHLVGAAIVCMSDLVYDDGIVALCADGNSNQKQQQQQHQQQEQQQ